MSTYSSIDDLFWKSAVQNGKDFFVSVVWLKSKSLLFTDYFRFQIV